MTTTVAELKQWLEQFDDDVVVVLACDAEGNAFSALADYATGYFMTDGHDEDFVTEDDVEDDERINIDGAQLAISLWPTD